MNKKTLTSTCKRLFPGRDWQLQAASSLGVTTSAMRRWMMLNRVPRRAVLALHNIEHMRKLNQ